VLKDGKRGCGGHDQGECYQAGVVGASQAELLGKR